jgi:hypothetical protein
MRTKSLSIFGAILFLAPALHAQFSGASRQVDSLEQRRQMEQTANSAGETNAAPELYPGETGDIGPQSVLKFVSRRTWFAAIADVQYFYSDNVFLADADDDRQSADVLVSTVQAAFAPSAFDVAGGWLAPRAGYQHQWFNYDLVGNHQVVVLNYGEGSLGSVGLDAFDFNASTVFADAAWRWRGWTFSVGSDYRRLLDSGNYREFYHEFVPRWSVRRDFPLCDTFALSLLYEGNFRFTETQLPPPGNGRDFNNRTDQSLAIIGDWRACRYFTLQPYYRLQATHYVELERDDVLHSFGLAAIFPVTRQAALRAFIGYDAMQTDGFFSQDYKKFDAGGGVNLSFRF